MVKMPPATVGDMGSVPGPKRLLKGLTRARAAKPERPPQWEARTTIASSSPDLPQLEKARRTQNKLINKPQNK